MPPYAMRFKGINYLCQQFSSVEKAEKYYKVDYEESVRFASKEGNVDDEIPSAVAS